MPLTDDIAADQQAVQAAQAQLDAANAKLADDQAKLAALQPHVSLLNELEALAGGYQAEISNEIKSVTARFRALLGL